MAEKRLNRQGELSLSTTFIWICLSLLVTKSNANSVSCSILRHPKTSENTLDCTKDAAQVSYRTNGLLYTKITKQFVQISHSKHSYWVLYPKLNATETISHIAPGGLEPLSKLIKNDSMLLLQALEESVTLEPLAALQSLRHIKLDGLHWRSLAGNRFRSIPRLKVLTISNCKILRSIAADAFLHLSELERLVITGNKRLVNISNMAFKPLVSLKSLVLKNPAFKTIAGGQFCTLVNLITLTISQRQYQFEADALVGLESLEELELDSSLFTNEALIENVLFQGLFDKTFTLCQLNDNVNLNKRPVKSWLTTQDQEENCRAYKKNATNRLCQKDLRSSSPCACTNANHRQATSALASRERTTTPVNLDLRLVRLPTTEQSVPRNPRKSNKAVKQSRTDTRNKAQHSTAQNANGSIWSPDLKSMTGTILLCVCAFVVGVLVTVYCWQSKKISKLAKPAEKSEVTGEDQVRLISYIRKDSGEEYFVNLREVAQFGMSPQLPIYFRR